MDMRERVVGVIRAAVKQISGTEMPAAEDTALVDAGAGLSSVQLIELISTLEQDLEFQFEEDDLRMSSFESLRTLADLVTARVRGGGTGA